MTSSRFSIAWFPVRIAPLLFVTLIQIASVAQSAHVLFIPIPYQSIVSEFKAIGLGLTERGHRVTVLMSENYPDLEAVRGVPGFHVVTYKVLEPDFNSPTEATDWIASVLESDPLDDIRKNSAAYLSLCTNPLEDPDLATQLTAGPGGRPDVAITDGSMYLRCHWILCHRLGIPYISLTVFDEPWIRRVPALPSFVPFGYTDGGWITERMPFWQRVRNAWTLLDWTAWPGYKGAEDDMVERYLPGETFASLAARNLLWLMDRDVLLDYPRPTMPNEVNIGGLTTGPAHSLADGPMEKFARMSANKLVIVSFGSMDMTSDRVFAQLFSAFEQVSELNFIWRVSVNLPAGYTDRWPKNILISKWIPQNDLIGHHNTVLFIGHGGANSQFEALYHGVPMICIPGFMDQMYNAARLQYHGYGLHMGRMTSLDTNKLVAGIREVVSNHSYTDNIRLASKIFQSQPMTPRQRAVWWIEHVVQNGAKHLHSYGVDMPWYQYLMLDIFAMFVLLPVIVISSCVTATVCWSCRKTQQKTHLTDKKLK